MDPAHGGAVGGIGGGSGNTGPSGVGPSGEGDFDIPRNFGTVPLKEEEYTHPLTQSRTGVGSSGFDATHFYHYMDDHFFRLNLRLDGIDEWRQQHAQDQQELLCLQLELFTSRTSTMVGPTLHPIRGLAAPRPLLMFCKFSPLPLVFFSYMLHLVALGTMFLLGIGRELVLIGGIMVGF